MPKQHFEVIDYFGPVVVAAIFGVVLFVISFFVINFFCITKHDDLTVFEKAAARRNIRLGPHNLRMVKAVVKAEDDSDDESLYSKSLYDEEDLVKN